MLADHDAAMSRRRPFREPAAFQISVDQTLLNLGADFGADQIVKRMRGAEGVPESAVGVKGAVMELAVVRAVVDLLALGVDLEKLLGEKKAAIEATVEGALLLRGGAFHLDAPEHLVPARLGMLADGVEISAADFILEIEHRLPGADVRGGDFAADDLV